MQSENKPSRKLAAILFADIVGYTAMMQSDEGNAVSRLNHYQEVLKKSVGEHNGEIIKNYGDGSLCLFTSVLDAVHCAKVIQLELWKEPIVPLRIGLHMGDVMYRDNDVYGNALNISSRIESMGVPGSIMMSKDIHKKVKNQADLRFESLGSFEFKNVDDPMEVFALANEGFPVPSREELFGKFKTQEISKEKSALQTWWPLIALLFIASALYFFINHRNTTTIEEPALNTKSIAVLPFTDLSQDQDQEYFSVGMMDEILNHLVKIQDLQVSSRTSSMQFANTTIPITTIAKQLGVANVLEGSVRKAGDQVRITVQLIDGITDKHLWSESYDRRFEDIFSIQSDVAQSIAGILEAEIYPEVKKRIEAVPTTNIEAYELWLKGQSGGWLNGDESRYFFLEAIKIDPNFAPAYASMGYSVMSSGGFAGQVGREEIIQNTSYYLEKALDLDPNYPLTHQILGSFYLWYHWDFDAAKREFLRYEELNPSSLNGNILDFYCSTGQFNKAKGLAEKIHFNDPNTIGAWARRGLAYALTEDHNMANAYYEKGMELFPESWYLKSESVRAFTFSGQNNRVIELVSAFEEPVPRDMGMLAIAYYHTSNLKRTDSLIKQLKSLSDANPAGSPSYYLAMIHAQMSEIDQAFQYLEKAYQNHELEMYWLMVEPPFKPLHNDPRWEEMLFKVGFDVPVKG